eukprot:1451952-Amphidinium_carterae.2
METRTKGDRAFWRIIVMVGGSAEIWGMPLEWNVMTERAITYFSARNIPAQNGTRQGQSQSRFGALSQQGIQQWCRMEN